MTAPSHRTGYCDACDGRGWQPCERGDGSILSVAQSTARDAVAKEAQRQHREQRAAELRAQADALERSLP